MDEDTGKCKYMSFDAHEAKSGWSVSECEVKQQMNRSINQSWKRFKISNEDQKYVQFWLPLELIKGLKKGMMF